MASAISAWNKVLEASEALMNETDVLEGRIATFENLAVACEVEGRFEEVGVFAEKVRFLNVTYGYWSGIQHVKVPHGGGGTKKFKFQTTS